MSPGGHYTYYQMGTIGSLLVTCVAKLYTALFVAGTSSPYFVPALVGGIASVGVAVLCWRGAARAFRAAAAVAAVTVVIDVVASGGFTAAGAILLAPEALVLVLAILAMKQLRNVRHTRADRFGR